MAVSASSTYALATLAKSDPAFVRRALTDAAGGDALALEALAERSGVADRAQLREAAALFLAQKLDVIFAGSADARAKAMTGGGAAPTFAANAGGVSSSRMSAFLGLRGGGAADAALTGQLRELSGQRAAKEQARAPIAAERTEKQAELDGLALNRRERWLGSWAGVLGGDSEKGEKGSKLRKELDGLDERLGELGRAIDGFTTEMHDATAKHLRLANDREFIALDQEYRSAHTAKGALDSLARTVRDARSSISSAESAERSEQWAEQSAEGKDRGSFEASNERRQQQQAQMAVARAESAIREVQGEARQAAAALRTLGKSADLGDVHTTDMGKTFDVVFDALGMDDGHWFFGSDAMVIRNLEQADRELRALQDRVGRAQKSVDAEHGTAETARTGYLEAVEAKLLEGS